MIKSWSKLLEENIMERNGRRRVESYNIELYIKKRKARERKNNRVLYSSHWSKFARLQQSVATMALAKVGTHLINRVGFCSPY
jgi:hypothetical protein